MRQVRGYIVLGIVVLAFIPVLTIHASADGGQAAGALKSIVISPEDAKVTVTSSLTFTATGFDDKGKQVVLTNVNWSISDTTLGEITKVNETSANFMAGTKAVQLGKLAVEATSGKVMASVNLTILAGEAVKITIAPISTSVRVASSVVFSATALDEFDNVVPGEKYNWNSTSLLYGCFRSSHGGRSAFVAGTLAGRSTVTVGSGPAKAIATVTVLPGQLTSVRIFPSELEVDSTDLTTFYAYPVDEYGNKLPGKFNFTWLLSHSFARITNTSDNNVTLSIGDIGGGTETVTATLGENLSAKASVKVRPALWLTSTLTIVLLTVVLTFLVRYKTRTHCPECGAPHWMFVEKCEVCETPMVRRPNE